MALNQQMPTRSAAGLGAMDIFYNKINEVNFYVEDAEQENLYYAILKKHFPTINFSKIFPLGGKPKVLSHAKDPVNKKIKAKRVYIVDRDYDTLLGTMESIKGVFYLEKYCIENYLLEPDAIIEIVVENNPKLKAAEIAQSLNLDAYLMEVESKLRELFLLFYASQLFDLGIKNCASKAEEFCESKKWWRIDPAKVSAYKNRILLGAVPPKADPAIKSVETDPRLQGARALDRDALVSGKFLLTLIFHYVKSKYSLGSITFESFVYRVAKNSTLESLSPTTGAITKHIASGRAPRKKQSREAKAL